MTCQAINDWLLTRNGVRASEPLFTSLDNRSCGHRLSGTSIYRIVRSYAEAAKIPKRVSPHRIRHSSITRVLDLNNGNTRAAQRFSRHADLRTLSIYDDNRTDFQGDLTRMLEDDLL